MKRLKEAVIGIAQIGGRSTPISQLRTTVKMLAVPGNGAVRLPHGKFSISACDVEGYTDVQILAPGVGQVQRRCNPPLLRMSMPARNKSGAAADR